MKEASTSSCPSSTELLDPLGGDSDQPVRLLQVASDLREELVRSHPHRSNQRRFALDFLLDAVGDYQFMNVIDSCRTVAIDTQTKYGT